MEEYRVINRLIRMTQSPDQEPAPANLQLDEKFATARPKDDEAVHIKEALIGEDGSDILIRATSGVHIVAICTGACDEIKNQIKEDFKSFLESNEFKQAPSSPDSTDFESKENQEKSKYAAKPSKQRAGKNAVTGSVRPWSKECAEKDNNNKYYCLDPKSSLSDMENIGKIFFAPYECVKAFPVEANITYCEECDDPKSWRLYGVNIRNLFINGAYDEEREKFLQLYLSEKCLNNLGPLAERKRSPYPAIVVVLFLPKDQMMFFSQNTLYFPAELELVLECVSVDGYCNILQGVLENKKLDIAAKDAIIADKDAIIAKKDAIIAEKDTKIMEKDAIIAKKDAIIATQRDEKVKYKDINGKTSDDHEQQYDKTDMDKGGLEKSDKDYIK